VAIMKKIVPFLWFDNQAEEAVKFYISVIKNSKIQNISYTGDDSSDPRKVDDGHISTKWARFHGIERSQF
jgi:predicted 3-demethylubiquinone-9 3-methyltransferase (glyoxalase superfamily)